MTKSCEFASYQKVIEAESSDSEDERVKKYGYITNKREINVTQQNKQQRKFAIARHEVMMYIRYPEKLDHHADPMALYIQKVAEETK